MDAANLIGLLGNRIVCGKHEIAFHAKFFGNRCVTIMDAIAGNDLASESTFAHRRGRPTTFE